MFESMSSYVVITKRNHAIMNTPKTLDYSGHTIYVGIDVHKKSWKVSVLSENSHFKTFSQNPSPEELSSYLNRNFPNADFKACYESGFSGYWAQRELKDLGIDCIVVNPADVPITDYEKSKKSDSIDSAKLGRSLRNDELRPIYIPSPEEQMDRDLVRYRRKLVRDQTRCKNRIKGFLHFHGIAIPEHLGNHHWSKRFIEWVKNIPISNESGKIVLIELLDNLLYLRSKVLKVTKQVRKLSKTSRYESKVNLLLTVPGIGVISAMTLLTELINLKRFKRLDDLCSFIGLVPDVYASGETHITKNLTHRSNLSIRGVIIESSWVAIRKDPALLLKFNELSNRMAKNKAIIRIAKKLVRRIKHVLENEQPYESAVVE